jgi:Cdc6-like AAA superfamily ATPase
MITDTKISTIQEKIKKAIEQIEKDENVKISFSSCRYNSAFYQTQMKVATTVKTDAVKDVYINICKKLGFTQNIVGMKFSGPSGIYEIVDIKPRNTKYPIIAKAGSKQYKYSVYNIKSLIGGDKIINRNANISRLLD